MKIPDERREEPARSKPLTELATGQDGVIVALEMGAGGQQRLRSIGLLEGQRIQKVSRIGKIGPVVILVDRTQLAVGNGMARKIMVQVSE